MVDISRATTGVSLPSELSAEIWADTIEQSVVMTAARQVALPGAGTTIHRVTSEPTAGWVGETEKKPLGRHGIANKKLTPYKLAIIEPFSMEFRRDLPNLYSELARRLPGALARAFDSTVFGGITAPGADFDQLSTTTTVQTVDSTDTLGDLVAAYNALVAADGDLSAWMASSTLAGLLLSAQAGTQGFDLSSPGSIGQAFGAPVYKSRATFPTGTTPALDTIGYAGDFQADSVWGSVEGVQVSISDQASLIDNENADATINLWEQNMFAVRAEIEVGFRTSDADRFVALQNDDGA